MNGPISQEGLERLLAERQDGTSSHKPAAPQRFPRLKDLDTGARCPSQK